MWLIGAALVAAACSGGDSPTPASTTLAAAPTSTVPPDGTLRIGLLLPETGPGAGLGASLLAGAKLAVSEINAAGGVLGRRVETVIRDEGASAATAAVGLDELVDLRVDAVVGPASSRVAYEVLPQAVRAGVLVCSPSATAAGLSDYPDADLFIRTVPGDRLQARAMARLIEQTGRNSAAVLAPDDDFGEDFAEELVTALRARNIAITADLRYDVATESPESIAAEAFAGEPGAAAVIGAGDSGAAMLSAARAAAGDGVPFFVNDALGSASVVEILGERAGDTVAGVRGTSVFAEPNDRSVDFADRLATVAGNVSDDFAAFAYDCVNLIALAAASAGSDRPSLAAAELLDVSNLGNGCSTFVECSTLLGQRLNIDLQGASGLLDLDPNGDVLTGTYYVFQFDESGRPVADSEPITVA